MDNYPKVRITKKSLKLIKQIQSEYRIISIPKTIDFIINSYQATKINVTDINNDFK